MADSNLKAWDAMRKVPAEFTKPIEGKRYQGTSIDPQWMVRTFTKQYGAIGVHWGYTILREWTEEAGSQVIVFVKVRLQHGEFTWEHIGSNSLVSKNGSINEECFKSATTDALTKCLSLAGCGADVYLDQFDPNYHEPKDYDGAKAALWKKFQGHAAQKGVKIEQADLGVILNKLSIISTDEAIHVNREKIDNAINAYFEKDSGEEEVIRIEAPKTYSKENNDDAKAELWNKFNAHCISIEATATKKALADICKVAEVTPSIVYLHFEGLLERIKAWRPADDAKKPGEQTPVGYIIGALSKEFQVKGDVARKLAHGYLTDGKTSLTEVGDMKEASELVARAIKELS